MDTHLKVGRVGEEKAIEMLIEKGYEIVEKNKKNDYGEIDIIVMDGKEVVFIEVRSRTGEKFGSPEETIRKRKKDKIKKNAQAYMSFKNLKNRYRVDVVCIVFNQNMDIKRMDHYKNITL